MYKQQSGFSMIELVIVIVIMGILAAVAAPKFMNIQGDAKISASKGTLSSIRAGIGIAHAKILASGNNTGAAAPNSDWPTLVEVQSNRLAETRIANTANTDLVQSDVVAGTVNASLPELNLPSMTTAQNTGSRQVLVATIAQAEAANRTTGASTGWRYYPGNSLRGSRLLDAIFYINNKAAANADGNGVTPNNW